MGVPLQVTLALKMFTASVFPPPHPLSEYEKIGQGLPAPGITPSEASAGKGTKNPDWGGENV